MTNPFYQFPTISNLFESGLKGTYYKEVVRDKLGVVRKSSFEGQPAPTHCARLICNHLWHGIVCFDCAPKWKRHRPRLWPGQPRS